MRVDTPEDVSTTGTTSVGEEKRSRRKEIKERDKKMLDSTSMRSCNLLKLPVIGDVVTNKKRIQ